MGLYNFQQRFAPFILDGRKNHTIRSQRACPDKPGNTLHLYTGLRCKSARLLMRVLCTKVQDILIEDLEEEGFRITVDGYVLCPDEAEALARADGFKSFPEMMQFWEGRLPFSGQIIHWSGARDQNHSGETDGVRIQKEVSADGMQEPDRSKTQDREVLLGRLPAKRRP